MEIVVVGRNIEVPERFRTHAEEKLAKIEQLAPDVQRVDLELTHERNPRLAGKKERIELTIRGRGPVIRAEAASQDRYSALDLAAAKLYERLRRARDRRHDRRKHRTGLALEVANLEMLAPPVVPPEVDERPQVPTEPGETKESQLGDSPVLVRQKLHEAKPMTVDQALYEMEMVGHPFYLFIDAATAQPCVVYHRHGWTYGVIRLNATCGDTAS